MKILKKQIAIIGAGAMGTALAVLISKNKKGRVKLWDRDAEVIKKIEKTRKNIGFLGPEIKIPKDVFPCFDLRKTIEGTDLILLAVPSFAIREVCKKIYNLGHQKKFNNKKLAPILMVSKGLEKETSLLPFQIVEEILEKKDILHLTWSGFAQEITGENKRTEILASRNKDLAKKFKNLFETDWLKISISSDLVGVQLGGALKNVAVIGIGLADKGDQKIKNKLIRESVREMIILGEKMGAEKETFEGPAGKVNLELSSDSRSRNYRWGKALFEKSVEEVQKDLKRKLVTLEGLNTTWGVHQLVKKYRLKLPIIDEVYKVIYKKKNPKKSAIKLIKLVENKRTSLI